MGYFFPPFLKSTELCSLQVQKTAEKQEKMIQTKKMRDTDWLLKLQKRSQVKAYTPVFQAAGGVSGGAAPVPSKLAQTGGG